LRPVRPSRSLRPLLGHTAKAALWELRRAAGPRCWLRRSLRQRSLRRRGLGLSGALGTVRQRGLGLGLGSALLTIRPRRWRLRRRGLAQGRLRRGLRLPCRRLPQTVAGAEPSIVPRLGHDGDIRHGFRPELDNSRFELRVDAPQQRAGVEIEQRTVGVHHTAGLGPGRQGVDGALLERLDNLNRSGDPLGEIRFGEVAGGPKVPKQLSHFRIIAGWH
jgi:hypothetical protein